MFKSEIKFTNLKGLKANLKKVKQEVGNKFIIEYINLLLGDGTVGVQAILERQLLDIIYSSDNNKVYKRTERLFDSVRVNVEDGKLLLYMDDVYLEQNSSNSDDIQSGTATNLDTTPYSLRVENDFIYKNRVGKDFRREGSKYMEKTYHEIKQSVISGDKNPNLLLKPIVRMWSK